MVHGFAWDWVTHALEYVDYNYDAFDSEMLGVCEFSFGGTTRQELLRMEFDRFTDLVRKTERAREEQRRKLEK